MEFNFWLAFLMFVLFIAYDFIYAVYYIFVAKKRAFMAANAACALYLLGSFSTITYIQNRWYIIPIILGSYIGTFVAVKYCNKDKKVEPTKPEPKYSIDNNLELINAEIATVKSILSFIPEDQVIDRASFISRLEKLYKEQEQLLKDIK